MPWPGERPNSPPLTTSVLSSLKKHCLIFPLCVHDRMMSDDMVLVREFGASQSEAAFAALVKRQIALVHSAAIRQVGDAHLAEEIAQAVFIILAQKALALGP